MNKRILSLILALMMIVTSLPVSVFAATDVYYQLDTSGKIEYGAEYLIVHSTKDWSTGAQLIFALKGTGTAGESVPVTVTADNKIQYVESLENCVWTIEEGTNSLKHGASYLALAQASSGKPSFVADPFPLNIDYKGSGKYSFYISAGSGNYVYTLAGATGQKFASHYTTKTYATGLLLFKKAGGPVKNTITFNGNGNTHGTVPKAETVETGKTYQFPAVDQDFRLVMGEETYAFWCWTENQDGTGVEYRPGDTITVERDMQLYAQWYKETKYTVSVVMRLNDDFADVEEILSSTEAVKLYIRMDQEGSPYIPLNRFQRGVYTAEVAENGTYLVYAQYGDEEPEAEHGHRVIIYNQSGSTELLNYSVSYDANGGAFQTPPETVNQHANTTVTATTEIPVLAGHRFLGWKDQNGKMIAPGEIVTDKLLEKTVLTAQWEDLVDVTVNITVNHKPETGGEDVDGDKALVSYLLMQQEGQAFIPYGEIQNLDLEHEDFVRQENGKTYYQVKYTGLPNRLYSVGTEKSDYEVQETRTVLENGDQIIDVVYTYVPDNFDVSFDVQVNMGDLPETLRPQAVNLRVTYWSEELQSWQTITQHGTGTTPVTVFIDENGSGSGFFSVWKEQTDSKPFYYRVRVSSFVMPDGTVVQANNTQANEVYVPDGSGLYTATVTVANGGQVQGTELPGAYYDGKTQVGKPLVTVAVTPYTVTFDAGDGLLNQKEKIVLENQYAYPDLRNFVPVPNEYDGFFTGWYVKGAEAENLAGRYLTGNVTYVAKYSPHMRIQGAISVGSTYEQNGQTVSIPEDDCIQRILVVLQKNINGVYNDVDSQLVDITYIDGIGTGEYIFDHLVADGTAYRIYVLQRNYSVSYDNNGDAVFAENEYDVFTKNLLGQVDLQLQMNPELYEQVFEVDAQRIGKDFRPDSVTVQILYRNLGGNKAYDTIKQQSGTNLALSDEGEAAGVEDVWKWHTNNTWYEYQLKVDTVYGQVPGVFTPEGVKYSNALPFSVQYDLPVYYVENGQQPALRATLVPNEYEVLFDMGLALGEDVEGMEDYHTDTQNGVRYSYHHTWSKTAEFEAYPYREGYVFEGWQSNNDHVIIENGGHVVVPAELAEDIVLTAVWTPLTSTDYAVYHLELNTNKVLYATQIVEGVIVNTSVVAAEAVKTIKGYEYAGARMNGVYYDKSKNPVLITNTDPTKNQLVIYYRPDGSDGYTEQVEENIYLNKTAVLEDDGTYTITMETYTKDNPITTRIQQNTPLDIVLVLDQSGSIKTSNFLGELQDSVTGFIELIAEHGQEHEVDHRIAIVGYASDEEGGLTTNHPPAGALDGTKWVNTGVFDSNGDFHVYPVTGFNYTLYTGTIETTGTYYTESNGEYLLMTFHDIYRHLITEEEAKQCVLNGVAVYGYVGEDYVQLTRNTSGLWLYGNKQLYSETEFFTQHTNVWTHRRGTEAREIHAYMVNGKYVPEAGHEKVFVRTETQESGADKSIYEDALIPVTMSAGGAGDINPGLLKSTKRISANGLTYVSYGMEMANRIFAANPQENGGVRIVVVFTDGKPGDSSNFDEDESNKAIAQSYIASNEHKARVFTVGVYGKDVANAESDQDYFMNGLSSNYPDAKSLDDVWVGVTYQPATPGYDLEENGPYFVEVNKNHYPLSREVVYEKGNYYISWGYDNAGTRVVVTRNLLSYGHPTIDANSQVTDVAGNKVTLYRRAGHGYKPAESKNYYTVAENTHVLKQYFADIVTSITTKITTQITLHDDTIMRDIMGQGMVLTPGTIITAYKQKGVFDAETNTVTWTGINEEVASVEIPENPKSTLHSEAMADISYELPDGTKVEKPKTPYISVYNLNSANPTNPNGEEYHPHTVDITGYDFTKWYIGEGNPAGYGYKMVVTISRVEATDDVVWGRSTSTNHAQSGLWLPEAANRERQLLLPFDQPTTIFVERAYVLDYGKQFTLSNWYFDDEKAADGTVLQTATPIHLDCNLEDGMNGFETANKSNGKNNPYGNTKYGNVQVEDDGTVTYTPTTMNWGGYDQFVVFGETWRKTVRAQSANENGNLWNKVTVIPANNIYYEDSFVTEPNDQKNGIEGFVFSKHWTVVSDGEVGKNEENPEHLENETFGKVHGWTDAFIDDGKYTDGSAHYVGGRGDEDRGATAEFTFTGTGVDVYTRTTATSGIVVAMLTSEGIDAEGNPVTNVVKSLAMDNKSVSSKDGYYHIPTVSFDNLPYGTYTLKLVATSKVDADTGNPRYEYYIDGARVYNPLGMAQNYASDIIKEAYGNENNAVFTEVRDILLQQGDFTPGIDRKGAVFIDQIKPDQVEEGAPTGDGTYTYDLGVFKEYGPKNEVYLSAGQAIVLRVAEGNTYYVGLKSLTGEKVTVNVSGIEDPMPAVMEISHTTDMYYQVTPVDGYIVIQNGGESGILSITNLRTTNPNGPVEGGGVVLVNPIEATTFMNHFSRHMEEVKNSIESQPKPDEPVQDVQDLTQQQVEALFESVRTWLKEEEK